MKEQERLSTVERRLGAARKEVQSLRDYISRHLLNSSRGPS